MASPLVAGFTYAVGSYDARPWWEAVSGLLTVVAGGVLTAGAVRGHPPTIAADEPAVMSSPNTTPAA